MAESIKSPLLILILGVCLILPDGTKGAVALSPSLERLLTHENVNPDSLISVVVFLDDSRSSLEAKRSASRRDVSFGLRHQMAIEELKYGDRNAVENMKRKVLDIAPGIDIRDFWIVPALAFEVSVSRLPAIAALPGLAAVYDDAGLELVSPVETSPAGAFADAVASHLKALNVPALWSRGLTGAGRLVCNFDTGVEGSHPALTEKWRGTHVPWNQAWFAPASGDTLPSDKSGHGTHTMGLMVGSTPLDSFGVAPDAEWISAAVIDQGQTLSRTISDIIAAFQWAADPDGDPATSDDVPDVILNSWGIPTSIMDPCDQTFYQVIDNTEAAGIVTIFAAGNEGPNPQSLRIPANRATTPLNTFAVGAIDETTGIIADFSSRGPSSCTTTEIKPEVVAPGVAIFSSYKGGGYILKSGTSMAAPLIAGLVVLLRQYDPEASPAEIKTAIIESARDLGSPGEDNDYGYGLPDAAAALSYMPRPANPEFRISDLIIGGDGIADPGESFELRIRLETISGYVDSLTAYLECPENGIEVTQNRADFLFLQKASYALNYEPFIIHLADWLDCGKMASFLLKICLPYQAGSDTLEFQIMVGRAPGGDMFTHVTSRIQFTVSDFGQYGLGENSVYHAGGVGFRLDGSGNILYESGLIVGRNPLQISSAVRDSSGCADESDFNPIVHLQAIVPEDPGSLASYAIFNDMRSDIPIPLTVSQQISSYDEIGHDGYIIMQYKLINDRYERMTGIYFGLLCDFDLSPGGDQMGFMAENQLVYQYGDAGYIGFLPLTDFNGALAIENQGRKAGLTKQQKFDYITRAGIDIDDSTTADLMFVLNFGPYNIAPFDSVTIAMALLAGQDLSEIQMSASRAIARFYGHTAVNDEDDLLPGRLKLYQNHPNPFNPSTVISFEIERSAEVKLAVFNILGQKVATIVDGFLSAGRHDIAWDATDDRGHRVASGVYFCRLTADSLSRTRKMLLVD
jgi:subtilisin family serine protease